MNFYEKIKGIATEFEPDSKTYMYPLERLERKSGIFEAFPVVVIDTTFSGSSEAIAGGGAKSSDRFRIRVLTQDTRDNWDAENNEGSSADGNSYELYLAMRKLADSIMLRFKRTTKFATNTPLSWTITPLFKYTSNTLTGVIIDVSFTVFTEFNCLSND